MAVHPCFSMGSRRALLASLGRSRRETGSSLGLAMRQGCRPLAVSSLASGPAKAFAKASALSYSSAGEAARQRPAADPNTLWAFNSEIEGCLQRLEQMAAEKEEPKRLRWRRQIEQMQRYHRRLSGSQLGRLFDALSVHPLALYTEATLSLLQSCIERLRRPSGGSLIVSETGAGEASLRAELGGADADTLAAVAAVLAQVSIGGVGEGGNNDDVAARAQDILWERCAPEVLKALREEEEVERAHARALMAFAVAWRTLPMGWEEVLLPDLRAVLTQVLEEAGEKWPHLDGGGNNLWVVARIVSAVGLLESQRAFTSFSSNADDAAVGSASTSDLYRVDLADPGERLLSAAAVLARNFTPNAGLDILLLMNMGLQGIQQAAAKGTSRFSHIVGRGVSEQLSRLLVAPGGSTGGLTGGCAQPREVVRGILHLHHLGRLHPREPIAVDMLLAAANMSDSLTQSEKPVLDRLLQRFAEDLGCSSGDRGVPSRDLPEPPKAGSPEASLCQLARLRWFSRKNRAQVSWHKQRWTAARPI
eukprot:TRINITY_DN26254_c0_g1_i3.p1 TRINITY_DN26254_c0_g1~~TRINITY_DN26254_c0_g1_i3.p1  ORF type:complete len:534 (+),score=123.44 TRINITY_DN26254_c0_g1_i3:101-1702(+)